MRLITISLLTILILVGCKDDNKEKLEFTGYSEFGNNLLAYTMDVPKGGYISFIDGSENDALEDWVRDVYVLYDSGQVIYITNHYSMGGSINHLNRFAAGDTSLTAIKPVLFGQRDGMYWKETRVNEIVVGYCGVSEDMLDIFESSLKSLKPSSELISRLKKSIEDNTDTVKHKI